VAEIETKTEDSKRPRWIIARAYREYRHRYNEDTDTDTDTDIYRHTDKKIDTDPFLETD